MDLTQFVADIDGHQRKIVQASVTPARRDDGDSGIALKDGRSLPFVIDRAWNAPAGIYPEQWFLVHPESREVLHEGPIHMRQVWGLLSWTEFTEQVDEPIAIEPGTYLLVFALGGIMGGQTEIEAAPAPAPV